MWDTGEIWSGWSILVSMIPKNWLPVSDSTYEELGSCHSILITSKGSGWKTNSSSWIYKRREVIDQTAAPRIKSQTGGEHRELRLSGQRLMNRICPTSQCWCRKIWTVTNKLLEARCGQSCELRTPREPSHGGCQQYCDLSPGSLTKFPQ